MYSPSQIIYLTVSKHTKSYYPVAEILQEFNTEISPFPDTLICITLDLHSLDAENTVLLEYKFQTAGKLIPIVSLHFPMSSPTGTRFSAVSQHSLALISSFRNQSLRDLY